MTKYIFVTGGVTSSLGKGITAASLGRILKNRGLKVTAQKFDPYLNYDPGTMSPFQHGEVFVTEDGSEADLDLGHYERFIDVNLNENSSVTTGKVYQSVIDKERRGEYLGGTVQVVPHITDEIKKRIKKASETDSYDVVITEIGGTVGDIEGLPFFEAIRQMKTDLGKENVIYIHVALIPYLNTSEELKTKPTQHSVKELRSIGIQPDIIVCRTEKLLDENIKKKIALFCDADYEAVIQNLDAKNLYEVPLMLKKEGLDNIVIDKLGLKCKKADLSNWEIILEKISKTNMLLTVGLVGKYVSLPDAYLSIIEALAHAGIEQEVDVSIKRIQAEDLEENKQVENLLGNVDGILVPGGFGERGIEGKIRAIKYARENKVPFLGICLGLQCVVIEFARNVLKLNDADSSEFNPQTLNPVIDLLPEQKSVTDKGGTMRLGNYPCTVKENTLTGQAYKQKEIFERHRHRYEFNNNYREKFDFSGMVFSGLSPDKKLVEIIELKDHPWFIATQFHPEFKSRPRKPHPLFNGFVKKMLNKNNLS